MIVALMLYMSDKSKNPIYHWLSSDQGRSGVGCVAIRAAVTTVSNRAQTTPLFVRFDSKTSFRTTPSLLFSTRSCTKNWGRVKVNDVRLIISSEIVYSIKMNQNVAFVRVQLSCAHHGEPGGKGLHYEHQLG